MKKGFILTTNHSVLLAGVAGGGKTHTMHLFLNRDPPEERTSTLSVERPVRTTRTQEKDGD